MLVKIFNISDNDLYHPRLGKIKPQDFVTLQVEKADEAIKGLPDKFLNKIIVLPYDVRINVRPNSRKSGTSTPNISKGYAGDEQAPRRKIRKRSEES